MKVYIVWSLQVIFDTRREYNPPSSPLASANKDCTAYDVIVNVDFFEEVMKRPTLKSFLVTLVLEGLEEKYNILLDRGM